MVISKNGDSPLSPHTTASPENREQAGHVVSDTHTGSAFVVINRKWKSTFFFKGNFADFSNADNSLKLFYFFFFLFFFCIIFFFLQNTVWAKENISSNWIWPAGHWLSALLSMFPAPLSGKPGPGPGASQLTNRDLRSPHSVCQLPSP